MTTKALLPACTTKVRTIGTQVLPVQGYVGYIFYPLAQFLYVLIVRLSFSRSPYLVIVYIRSAVKTKVASVVWGSLLLTGCKQKLRDEALGLDFYGRENKHDFGKALS